MNSITNMLMGWVGMINMLLGVIGIIIHIIISICGQLILNRKYYVNWWYLSLVRKLNNIYLGLIVYSCDIIYYLLSMFLRLDYIKFSYGYYFFILCNPNFVALVVYYLLNINIRLCMYNFDSVLQ